MLATSVLTGDVVTHSSIELLIAIIGLITMASIALGFYIQIRSIRKKSQEEMDTKVEKEGKAIRREVETESALRAMKESIDKLTETVTSLRNDVSVRVDKIEAKVERNTKIIVRLDQSLKAAHNRLDEHRTIEHGLTNHKNHSGSIQEDPEV
jgi:hypothetical protein